MECGRQMRYPGWRDGRGWFGRLDGLGVWVGRGDSGGKKTGEPEHINSVLRSWLKLSPRVPSCSPGALASACRRADPFAMAMPRIDALQARLQAAKAMLTDLPGAERRLASSAQASAVVEQCAEASDDLRRATASRIADLVELAATALWEPSDRSRVIRAVLGAEEASGVVARPAQADAEVVSGASGSEGALTPRDGRWRTRSPRTPMQTYMPALLAYFTHREWTHLYAAASSQLLRMHIIFSKLISLGCWAPCEPDLKMLAAVLLLLEYGQDASRLSLETRVATQESVKCEWQNFRRRHGKPRTFISALPGDPASLAQEHPDTWARAFDGGRELPELCRLNVESFLRLSASMHCRNIHVAALLARGNALRQPETRR